MKLPNKALNIGVLEIFWEYPCGEDVSIFYYYRFPVRTPSLYYSQKIGCLVEEYL